MTIPSVFRLQVVVTEVNGVFSGAVECSPSEGGGDTTAQSSSPSSLTGSSQGTDRGSSSNRTDSSSNSKDGDSDGIPDSSDKCPHNSHHRCFKEDTNNNINLNKLSRSHLLLLMGMGTKQDSGL